MAKSIQVMRIIFSLIFLFNSCYRNVIGQQRTARWCVMNDEEQLKLNDFNEAIRNYVAEGMNSDPELSARLSRYPKLVPIRARDPADCMARINKFEADLVSLDAGDIYRAGQEFNLAPLLAEVYGTDQGVSKPQYNSVAVVKTDDKSIQSISDLKGKKSCHTGVGRSAGWVIPIGILLKSGVMDVADCNNPVLSASKFFSASCAPGSNNVSFAIGAHEQEIEKMCSLCAGLGHTHCSRTEDPYAGYDGAFKCLRDGAGDVAFVKDATPLQMTQGQTKVGFRDVDFQLLCPDGRRASIYESSDCFWGSSPAHAVMTLSGQSDEAKKEFKNLLLTAQKIFGVNGTAAERFRMFKQSNSKYGRKDLLFKDSTVELIDVGRRNTYKDYLGSYAQVIEGNSKCDIDMLGFCVVSDNELHKLSLMARTFSLKGWKPKIVPIKASSHEECMKKVNFGDADTTILDGGDAYAAGSKYGLVPIMHENYGTDDASYYGVAVVHKHDRNISLKNLKGAQSCHTGIGKTAGWNVPVSFLIESGQISRDALRSSGCNVPGLVSRIFTKSCAPGARDPRFFVSPNKSNPHNLCALCKGTGANNCLRNSAEPFYDYSGSFRCLVESGPGTVGFMKHSTVLDNTNGNNQQDWARGLSSQNFELLCRDGTRKSVDQWRECYITRVPAEVMMTSSKKSPKERQIIIDLFTRGQESFGQSTKINPDTFSMFRSEKNEKNTLFKDDTVKLEPIPTNKQNYVAFLGNDYINMVADINCDSKKENRFGPSKQHEDIMVFSGTPSQFMFGAKMTYFIIFAILYKGFFKL